MGDLISVTTKSVNSIRMGRYTVTPFAKSVRIQPPGFRGIFIWNRPHALAIKTSDGVEKIYTIPDVTRYAQYLILGIGLIGSLVIWLVYRKDACKRAATEKGNCDGNE